MHGAIPTGRFMYGCEFSDSLIVTIVANWMILLIFVLHAVGFQACFSKSNL